MYLNTITIHIEYTYRVTHEGTHEGTHIKTHIEIHIEIHIKVHIKIHPIVPPIFTGPAGFENPADGLCLLDVLHRSITFPYCSITACADRSQKDR